MMGVLPQDRLAAVASGAMTATDWTAVGTIALAFVTVVAIITTIIITKQDRDQAAARLHDERRHEREREQEANAWAVQVVMGQLNAGPPTWGGDQPDDTARQDDRGDHRPDAEDLCHAAPRCPHVGVQPFPGLERCWSRRRRSSRNWAASSRRARATASAGPMDASMVAAQVPVISLDTQPPGTRAPKTACSRQATWVRDRPRSRYRLDHTFSTAA